MIWTQAPRPIAFCYWLFLLQMWVGKHLMYQSSGQHRQSWTSTVLRGRVPIATLETTGTRTDSLCRSGICAVSEHFILCSVASISFLGCNHPPSIYSTTLQAPEEQSLDTSASPFTPDTENALAIKQSNLSTKGKLLDCASGFHLQQGNCLLLC